MSFLHDLSISDVCTKYQEAAKIVNLALQGIVSQCLPGAKVIDLCEFGHTILTTQAAKLFTKKVNGQMIDRGVAFPVCISVNDVVCNHSPLLSEERVSNVLHCGGRMWLSVFSLVKINLLGSIQVYYECAVAINASMPSDKHPCRGAFGFE